MSCDPVTLNPDKILQCTQWDAHKAHLLYFQWQMYGNVFAFKSLYILYVNKKKLNAVKNELPVDINSYPFFSSLARTCMTFVCCAIKASICAGKLIKLQVLWCLPSHASSVLQCGTPSSRHAPWPPTRWHSHSISTQLLQPLTLCVLSEALIQCSSSSSSLWSEKIRDQHADI